MPRTPIVGDIVNYIRDGELHAAIVTKAYPDNAADLSLVPAYGEVGFAIAQVTQSDNEEPGYYFYPKAAQTGASTPKQNAAEHTEHKKH